MAKSLLVRVFPSCTHLVPRYFCKVRLSSFVRFSRRDLDRGGGVLFIFQNILSLK